MKVKKSHHNRRFWALAALLFFVILLISLVFIGLYYVNQHKADTQTTNSNQGSSSKTSSKATSGLPNDADLMTTDQVPVSSDLSVSITSLSQSDQSVIAKAKTSGNGTCVFLFQPSDNSKPVTRQVSTSNNSCSVNIPVGEFAYLGVWKLTVNYYNNNARKETSRDVSIN